ncbi:hypothetical protein K458DRAFT_388764 [Lentithecium fluviatile CBS 122367]|uniref:Uncharacterized protein n=1 Tax=Lentithecium fluviatile CBS 122367 TaxID=1168545 RepID=A0A6G1J1M6_9PLEO|nr:hypothetical protein K458DRAFT_388764 [Lentithecium fluviatile CBS 122367]
MSRTKPAHTATRKSARVADEVARASRKAPSTTATTTGVPITKASARSKPTMCKSARLAANISRAGPNAPSAKTIASRNSAKAKHPRNRRHRSDQHRPEAQQPTEPESIISLPQELRDMIWTYVMSDLPTRFTLTPDMPIHSMTFYPAVLPDVAFVSCSIRVEVILAWLRRTRIIFGQDDDTTCFMFREFLDQFENGRESVRMVTINAMEIPRDEWYVYHRTSPWFLETFSGLTSLTIMLNINNLLKPIEETTLELKHPRTSAELKESWHLGPLFASPNFRTLSIGVEVDVTDWLIDHPEVQNERWVTPLMDVLQDVAEKEAKRKPEFIRVWVKPCPNPFYKMIWVECVLGRRQDPSA